MAISGKAAIRQALRAVQGPPPKLRSGIVVTGLEEIDGNIVEFDRVVLPAELRKGTRDAAKLVLSEFQARCPVRSGAMRDSAVVRSMGRVKGKIGHTVKILRDRLFRLYEARTGHTPNPRVEDDEPFFYPSIVELGDADNEGQSPLRGSLYDSETAIKVEFGRSVLRAINHPKLKTAKL